MGLFDFLKKKAGDGGAASGRVRELIAQLGGADRDARLAACRELGALGPAAAAALDKLQELIDDDDGDVCNAAAAAMSEIER